MEIWKPIVDYEKLYEVSNFGRVRSLDKYRKYRDFETRFVKGKILKLTNCLGYRTVTLSCNGKRKNYRVHRLVSIAFIKNELDKPDVNHIDGNKKNNNVDNLEWVTKSENIIHSYEILKRKSNKGTSWIKHNFTENECLKMVKLHKNGFSFRKISRIFNSNHDTISKIIRNEKYNN